MSREYGRYDEYGNSREKKGWTVSISLGKVIIMLLLWAYPANWMMMRHGVGFYNNDPNHVWADREKGPSPFLRTISFVFSPLTAPVCGIYWGMEASIPQQPTAP